MGDRLPDFLCVGGEKCATTWLHDVLRRHPGVYLPTIKETRYFESEYERSHEWYAGFFKGARSTQVIGEVCPQYLHCEEAARRIARDLPGAKIVVSLRDPVDRAYSQYWMDVRGYWARGEAPPPFEELATRGSDYLRKGLYARQIQPYVASFGKERVFILFSERLRTTPLAEVNRLLRWLGVSEVTDPGWLGAEKNQARRYVAPRLFGATRGLVSGLKRSPAARLVWWAKRVGIRDVVINAFERPARYPEMDAATRERLRQYFVEPNEDLRHLLEIERLPWQ